MAIDTSALGFTWNRDEGTLTPLSTKETPPRPTAPTTDRAPCDILSDAIAVLRTIHDPEIPLNIYDLGLVYEIVTEPAGFIDVKMTLTSPMCPAIGSLPPDVKRGLGRIAGVSRVDLELVWDPPWTKDRMTEAARLQLNLD